MKSAALLFGLNYSYMSNNKLQGCIPDVQATAAFLKEKCQFTDVATYTDDSPQGKIDTSYAGILKHLYQFAMRTWSESIDLVWIHYSGHGGSVIDMNGDEKDRKDETLCPSDFDRAGDIRDDVICDLLKSFNPRTVVIMVIDACHSGTMADLRFLWNNDTSFQEINEIKHKGRIVVLSGCRDDQTSADAQITPGQYAGAFTNALLNLLKYQPITSENVFQLMKYLQEQMKPYSQIPQITSSVNLIEQPWFLPTEAQLMAYQNTLEIDSYIDNMATATTNGNQIINDAISKPKWLCCG